LWKQIESNQLPTCCTWNGSLVNITFFVLGYSSNSLVHESQIKWWIYLWMKKSSKPFNVHFAKGKQHQTSQIATNIEMKCTNFTFIEDFTVSNIDEIVLILEKCLFWNLSSRYKKATNIEGGEIELERT